MKLRIYALPLAITLFAGVISSPAHAEGFTATLSKSTNLSRTSESVTLEVAGVPDGQGIYLLQCLTPAVAGERPTACVGQNKTIWASTTATPGAQLLGASLALTVEREISAGGTLTDCSVSSCGVFIRRDHRGPSDKTLDTFIALSFLAPYGVAVSKTSNIAVGGEDIKVTVAGLTSEQGVYVRLCKGVADGQRPTLCDGLGVWASMNLVQQGYGAVRADQELTLAVKPSFGTGATAVDCLKNQCVVFVRRDHNAGSDLLLDKVIPLSFTAPVALEPTAKVSKVGNYFVFVIKNAKAKTVKVTVGTSVKSIKPTSENYTYRVAVGKSKGKKTALQVLLGSKVLAKGNLLG